MHHSRRGFLTAVAGTSLAASYAGDLNAHGKADDDPKNAVCDFSASYITFVTKGRGNLARLQVESRCLILDSDDRVETEFWQFASCKSEATYAEENLFTTPNYDFSGIFSRQHYVIFRARAPHTGVYDERGIVSERFEDLLVQVRPAHGVANLPTNPEIVEATLKGLPLVGRTKIQSPDGLRKAILEYPVKTMNVNDQRVIYQVDTGPIAFPDFSAERPAADVPLGVIDRMDLAYVAYNTPDDATFILQRPMTLETDDQEVCKVCHYFDIRRMPAVNSLMSISG